MVFTNFIHGIFDEKGIELVTFQKSSKAKITRHQFNLGQFLENS